MSSLSASTTFVAMMSSSSMVVSVATSFLVSMATITVTVLLSVSVSVTVTVTVTISVTRLSVVVVFSSAIFSMAAFMTPLMPFSFSLWITHFDSVVDRLLPTTRIVLK